MKLIKISEENYYDYRIKAMFDCYKWDPQFCNSNTLAKHVLVLSSKENNELIELTQKLEEETRLAEEYLNKNVKIAKKLFIPKQILKQIPNMKNYDEDNNIRLMRFDFHQSTDKRWVVTEVNSDVPGGFAESSLLPNLARETINMPELTYNSFGEKMVEAINNMLHGKGTIMMVHCTCFSDDRQVMQYMGDRLQKEGYNIIYGAADHINFKNNRAYCILNGNNVNIDFIFRFTPLEWLIKMKLHRCNGYFNCVTPSCNNPVAIYAQSKRFPMVWEDLEKAGIKMNTWKMLMPKTYEVKRNNKDKIEDGKFIYKPVYGRVGERISIKEACKEDEFNKILKDVKKRPKQYIIQEKFESMPLEGKYHVCIGSYTINGNHAGYYARMNTYPRIDSYAADIPVLVEED